MTAHKHKVPGHKHEKVKALADSPASGITLRDHLACAALQGMVSLSCQDYEHVAHMAYAHADAMLLAREIEPEPMPEAEAETGHKAASHKESQT